MVARCAAGCSAQVVWGWSFGVAWRLGFGWGGLGGSAWLGVVDATHGLGLVPLVGGLYVSLCA